MRSCDCDGGSGRGLKSAAAIGIFGPCMARSLTGSKTLMPCWASGCVGSYTYRAYRSVVGGLLSLLTFVLMGYYVVTTATM